MGDPNRPGTVTECCKCQSQDRCQATVDANYPNRGGVKAMGYENDVVDKSKFFCHLNSKLKG